MYISTVTICLNGTRQNNRATISSQNCNKLPVLIKAGTIYTKKPSDPYPDDWFEYQIHVLACGFDIWNIINPDKGELVNNDTNNRHILDKPFQKITVHNL